MEVDWSSVVATIVLDWCTVHDTIAFLRTKTANHTDKKSMAPLLRNIASRKVWSQNLGNRNR